MTIALADLVEYGPPVEVALPYDAALSLAGCGLVDVTRALTGGGWVVAPKGRVGAVRVGDLTVRVAPKVRIDRLLFLLEYGLERVAWLPEDVGVAPDEDLLHAVAVVFARATEDAIRAGLLQGYRTVEDALPVLRGRMRSDEQLRRRHGLAVPVEVRYDDFTVDTDENRLLRAATERLLRLPALPKETRVRLHRLLFRFADVSRLVRGAPRPAWTRSRLTTRYAPALQLADLVLAGSSFEHQGGSVRVSGFVLDMARVFEDFVTVALRRAMAPYGGRILAQSTIPLDEDGEVSIRPDVLWRSHSGEPLAVLDAKYKAERPSGYPDADLYQALAYATSLGLTDAHLVYARGNDAHRSHVVRHSGVRLTAHALDLAAEPADLLAQVDTLASRLHEQAALSA